jgi:glycosyltransferase involved in cell wall biosynthesis
LHPIDIGLMPLPEDRWSRGKCGCKALQYMSMAIPAVCSPTGVNSEIVQNGENGYIAATEEEWEDRLTLLLRSPELRKKIGAAGRLTVEEKYSRRIHVPRIYRIFKSLIPA